MFRPLPREPYSYRADPRVPAFDDSGPVVFMDGECALCVGAARQIARIDRQGEFRICPVQSLTGKAVMRHFGLDPEDPASWLYLEEGQAYGSLDAVIRAGRRLGGRGRLLTIFFPLPAPLKDWLYRRVARNRRHLWGRADICHLPDPELRRRLIQ